MPFGAHFGFTLLPLLLNQNRGRAHQDTFDLLAFAGDRGHGYCNHPRVKHATILQGFQISRKGKVTQGPMRPRYRIAIDSHQQRLAVFLDAATSAWLELCLDLGSRKRRQSWRFNHWFSVDRG
jgi:hypothetical protein